MVRAFVSAVTQTGHDAFPSPRGPGRQAATSVAVARAVAAENRGYV
jgi:hypothetical protein